MYTANIVSTVLFESAVSVFCIPPHPPYIFDTNIWNGLLRFVEQEVIDDHPEGSEGSSSGANAGQKTPYQGLRAKLELVNIIQTENGPEEKPFGEVWYNPAGKSIIANDGGDTIEHITARDYKVLVQLPNTGYYVSEVGVDRLEPPVQVGLGLRFHSREAGANFWEWLHIYRNRFNYYAEQIQFDSTMDDLSDDFGEFATFGGA
ncbi:hypothetical protein DICA4_D21242 [Diutina catenulata]